MTRFLQSLRTALATASDSGRDLSAFEEGRRSGYRDDPRRNPYRKGWPCSTAAKWADEYDAGYRAGQEQGRADVMEKRLSACR